MTRWHTPVDDENCILFGWRHFNAGIDLHGDGSEEGCGTDKIDFLDGQCERPYEVGQRAPGDWDAICSQRKIAVHAMENPGISDVGVYMCRKLLRDLTEGRTPPDTTKGMSEDSEETLHAFGSDTTLQVPRLTDRDEDRKLMKDMGRRVYAIMADADPLPEQGFALVRHWC